MELAQTETPMHGRATLVCIDMGSCPDRATGVLPHPYATHTKTLTAVGYNGWHWSTLITALQSKESDFELTQIKEPMRGRAALACIGMGFWP